MISKGLTVWNLRLGRLREEHSFSAMLLGKVSEIVAVVTDSTPAVGCCHCLESLVSALAELRSSGETGDIEARELPKWIKMEV